MISEPMGGAREMRDSYPFERNESPVWSKKLNSGITKNIVPGGREGGIKVPESEIPFGVEGKMSSSQRSQG